MLKRALILCSLICITLSISSCGIFNLNFSFDEDRVAESEKIVAKFNNDIRSNAIGKFEDYFQEDCDFRDEFNRIADLSFIAEKEFSKLGKYKNYISEDNLLEWQNEILWRIYANIDYTIYHVSEDDDEVSVFVNMKVPDFDSLVDFSKVDMDAILSDSFGENIQSKEAFVAELALRKGMTVEELEGYYKGAHEKEYIRDAIELFSDEWDKVISKTMALMFENCSYNEYHLEYSVEKGLDGEYRISEVSDID